MKPWHILVLAAGVAAPLLAWSLGSGGGTAREGLVWAYDTGTGSLFATSQSIPPMDAPSGPEAGVLAHAVIFAGERVPTVVYLTTLTPEAKHLVLTTRLPEGPPTSGVLVRRPEDPDWTPMSHPAAAAIVGRTAELAAGRTWRVAVPP